MREWSPGSYRNHRSPFGKHRQPSRLAVAVTAVALLVSCANPYRSFRPEDPTRIFNDWLEKEPRKILISSRVAALNVNYKSLVSSNTETTTARSSGASFPCGDPISCTLGLIVLLPLAIAAHTARSSKGSPLEVPLETSGSEADVHAISTAVERANVMQKLSEKLASGGQGAANQVRVQKPTEQTNWDYPTSPSEGRIEILFEKLNFVETAKNSGKMTLDLAVKTQTKALIKDVYCIFESRTYTYQSDPQTFRFWADNAGEHLNVELGKAIESVSDQLIRDLFLQPKAQAFAFDIFNSPVALRAQAKWKRDIRDILVPGKSTDKDVVSALGSQGTEYNDPEFGHQVTYYFDEQSMHPLRGKGYDTRFFRVYFDENNIVKRTETSLDYPTAIHRIDQIVIAKSTKEDVLAILGTPMKTKNNQYHFRYRNTKPGPWELEVLFNQSGMVRYVYQKKGEVLDFAIACEAARHGSRVALEELGHYFYFGNTTSGDTMAKAYKWYLILKRNGGEDLSNLVDIKKYSQIKIREAELQAASWPAGPCP